MEGRNKKLLLSLLVLVLLVSIGKETYALFTNEVSSIVQSYGTGTLKLSYSNTSINLDNAYPMTDTDGMSQSDSTITITNIGTLAYKFNVILDPSSNSTISSDLIRVSMDGENPATLSTDSNIIIRDVILNPGSSRTFTIKLWINSNTSSTDILNKKFSASLTSTGIAVKNMADSNGTVLIGEYTGPLYDYIKNSADKTTTIDFSKTSEVSNTNGIYMTTNTEGNVPVYYYRGNVDNRVIFANLCWEIIRTTETGGVKLIYDGVPSNGTCANTGASSYLPNNSAFNSSFDSPAYVGYMYGPVYTYSSKTMSSLSGNIIYGNDVSYDAATGKYTLVDTITKAVANWKTDYTTIGSKYHYTCFTNSNTCTQVNYMYYSYSSSSYYFILTNGKKQIDILNEMLNNNTNESTAKKAIDSWYKTNMASYTSQLEDTVFCNDRSIYSYGGWDKDTSHNSNYLYFGALGRLDSNKQPSLICSREIDKFTVNGDNGNGTLTYPVGLISADEIAYAGGVYNSTNTSFYLYTGDRYMWPLSPYNFGNLSAGGFSLSSAGRFGYSNVGSASGLRPVVSLQPGIAMTGGSGTATDPFVIG